MLWFKLQLILNLFILNWIKRLRIMNKKSWVTFLPTNVHSKYVARDSSTRAALINTWKFILEREITIVNIVAKSSSRKVIGKIMKRAILIWRSINVTSVVWDSSDQTKIRLILTFATGNLKEWILHKWKKSQVSTDCNPQIPTFLIQGWQDEKDQK